MTKQRGHGEGSIFQRNDGRWVASITLEGRKRKTFYGKTRKEVQEKLRVALNEQKQGTLITGPQQTVREYMEHWLEEVHKPTIRVGSYARYQSILNKHILPTLGHIQLQKLTPQKVQALYTQKVNEGLAPKTVHNIHGLLHKALDNAVRWGLVSRNVCEVVSVPRVKRHEIQPLTKEQAQLLLEQARGHKLEALLTLALVTGMRRGELLALRWQDVNFEAMSLQVRRTVNRIENHGYVENEPKTAKGRRVILLPAFVVEMLKQHRAQQQEGRVKADNAWEDHDLVFCNNRGKYLNPDYLLVRFQRLLSDAGLPHLRFHDLRHSAATILLTMGVHPKVVQELLGHSQISMTMDIYSHVLPSMQQEAMGRMGDVFGHEDQDEDDKQIGGDREG